MIRTRGTHSAPRAGTTCPHWSAAPMTDGVRHSCRTRPVILAVSLATASVAVGVPMRSARGSVCHRGPRPEPPPPGPWPPCQGPGGVASYQGRSLSSAQELTGFDHHIMIMTRPPGPRPPTAPNPRQDPTALAHDPQAGNPETATSAPRAPGQSNAGCGADA